MQQSRNQHMYKELPGTVTDPPCDIAETVIFVNGTCPISGCKKCTDCIKNDFDAICVWYLKNKPETFGQA